MTSSLSKCLSPVMALLIVTAPLATADARTNRNLKRGIQLLSQAEDEKALIQFRRALKRRKNPRSTRAKIHMYLGITYLNLLKEAKAERHFRKALRLKRSLTLPSGVSPKISGLVDRLRDELKGAPAGQQGGPPLQQPKVKRQPPQPIPPVVQRPGQRGGKVYWPAFLALGVAVAAGGTGLALGIVSKSKANEAHDLATPTEPAEHSHSTAKKMALTANILYGVAGAAAIASGALFYWGSQQGKERRVSSLGLAPMEGGALLQVGGFF